MNVKEIEQKVWQVVDLLESRFDQDVSEPIENTGNCNLSNFLRNGPNRKIVIFKYYYGDYEYDELISEDVEISISIANDAIYNTANNLLTKQFGPPQPLPIHDYNQLPFARIAKEKLKENKDYDWTPEYEGGALFENADDFIFSYWIKKNQYIVLQNGKIWGDGDFTFFVLVTISKF
ncbi:hypothetical protein [Dyadobacter chenhuakuii]|uniref:Site-specific DNA-methyltransferase (adenine-specific) n=1 Tax=Dyadobacter chenhuakuii TaxID=2909339 RepID=A0ABY4XH31_9BACT|nr:hypothetical protein [Dyadobacter chenhuakuii]MCF2495701.1 hypothetical protein [Dyadobacter chenhuakuii]USJ29734.1 hypothetical protein NFI80_17840 [Dyadobacter chenhuakuii]